MALRGVLFDLGGTLLDFCPNGGWQDMEYLGAAGWHDWLVKEGHNPPDRETVQEAVWEQMQSAWFSLGQGRDHELPLANQLHLAATHLGLDLTPEAIDLAGFIAPVQDTLALIPGAVETLQAVRERGLPMALISNTMWPARYHRDDLARFGLLEYFDVTLFSADEAVWKPDPEIFHRALGALGLEPEATLYVGDALPLDIKGAQDAGMRGVWIESDFDYVPEGMTITPDATIRQILDLIPIIDTWRTNKHE